MNSNQPYLPSNSPLPRSNMDNPCRHPRVAVVSREEDAEYVECQDCREIFEASEFKDMAIEETVDPDTDA